MAQYQDYVKKMKEASGNKSLVSGSSREFVPAKNSGPMKPKSGTTDPRRGDAIRRRMGQSKGGKFPHPDEGPMNQGRKRRKKLTPYDSPATDPRRY